jgi:uncharacterized LabA/DUF88 family protein
MKKTAVLLDLGFVLHKLRRALGRPLTADEVHRFALGCLDPSEEELFRIYCYHCAPYAETEVHPLTRQRIDFAGTGTFAAMKGLLQAPCLKDDVAYRAGEISFDGWVIRKRAATELARTGRALKAEDFAPDLKQKRVDMKIGLDVAWLASNRIVDRIVLVTADSDFVPAMKFARREGMQVVLVPLAHSMVKEDLLIHADRVRPVSFP